MAPGTSPRKFTQTVRAYERNHLNALAATFAPKLSRCLPPEIVRLVVECAFHVGDY